jgi:hypothetical protein
MSTGDRLSESVGRLYQEQGSSVRRFLTLDLGNHFCFGRAHAGDFSASLAATSGLRRFEGRHSKLPFWRCKKEGGGLVETERAPSRRPARASAVQRGLPVGSGRIRAAACGEQDDSLAAGS